MKAINFREIETEKAARLDTLLTECRVFWAFSNEQFASGKTHLDEGDKYVSIGAGGYLPKSLAKKFMDGMDANAKWAKKAVKDSKLEEVEILSELINHEAFYTGDIEDTANSLPQYTPKLIQAVYNKNRAKYEK